MGAVQGNNSPGQPWLYRPLTESPIESVESRHNEPSQRLSPAAVVPFVPRSLPPVSPALSSLSIDGRPTQFGETGPIDPREPQPSPNPHAHRWYSPDRAFGTVYDSQPSVKLSTSALGLRFSPLLTSFQRTPQNSLSTVDVCLHVGLVFDVARKQSPSFV